jgi:hypothetical protein
MPGPAGRFLAAQWSHEGPLAIAFRIGYSSNKGAV